MFKSKGVASKVIHSISMEESRIAREELKNKITAWKKKSWLDFCKLIMEEDKRYTLMPLTDYQNRMGNASMPSFLDRAEGVFSNFCLTRSGELSDVYITPQEGALGVKIEAGSKYTKLSFTGYPSKGMVWPIVRSADELERQFNREVSIESNKHVNSKRRTDAKLNSGTDSVIDSGNKLSTNK